MGRKRAKLPKDPQQLAELPGILWNGHCRHLVLDPKRQLHFNKLFRHQCEGCVTVGELQRAAAHTVYTVSTVVPIQLELRRQLCTMAGAAVCGHR